MNSKCFLLLAFAFLGASAAPLVSTGTVAVNNLNGGVGPTVSETVVSPFHRTDSVSTPCGHSVVRTTVLPVVPYGLARGTNFLGTGAGLYPGVVTGTGVGAFPGVVAGGFAGGVYPGIVTGGLTLAGGYNGVGGVTGAGITAGGLGVYPSTVV